MLSPLLYAVVGLALSAGLLWYLLITTEGVYLGRRVVIWLYDRYAKRYDRIKGFDPEWESKRLGEPLCEVLEDIFEPLILDVGTGSGRLPLALLRESHFSGLVVGVDLSWNMLKAATERLTAEGNPPSVQLIYAPAERLPFPDDLFDAVSCLEVLEFLTDQHAVIAELVRVLRPGGVLLVTNRKGRSARLLPGKTQSAAALAARLNQQGMVGVEVKIWQVLYDQVWSFKGDV
ncbi:MAG TPA: methyltransferase domain-containing protein [Aggregatilineales bacterium]|nr:methyltransferase domain-containing protein [Anaerolineales bacterium]HRE48678.1 methyltransferase domain-containing protein [Aggregatilineales bacterium]